MVKTVMEICHECPIAWVKHHHKLAQAVVFESGGVDEGVEKVHVNDHAHLPILLQHHANQ